ncbi:DUF1844 domain-containing protein [Vulgatibacter sp.]|uniref:DUF1844 domain-containing protein n=1 Tax=Vulgatibacter sp. TaxID=1971226 RepID=UPI00356AC353
MAEREEDKGFVVSDRRRFHEEPAPEGTPPPGAASTAADAIRGGPSGPDPEAEPVGAPQPGRPIDFTTFVFSLGSSALMHLGDAPHPETGEVRKELALAKETIDLLALLQQKTKGNLTAEEERFLGALIYDLRLRFIEAARS